MADHVTVISHQCTMHVNNMELKFPNQLFINGEFKDAIDGKTYDTINPNNESVRHHVTQVVYVPLCPLGHL